MGPSPSIETTPLPSPDVDRALFFFDTLDFSFVCERFDTGDDERLPFPDSPDPDPESESSGSFRVYFKLYATYIIQALVAFPPNGYGAWRLGGTEAEPMHRYYDPWLFHIMAEEEMKVSL